jgi:hypothetical protein
MKTKTIISLSFLLVNMAFSACLCNYETRTVQDEYETSQCVVIAKVISKTKIIDSEGFISHYKYELLVGKRFKGDCPKQLIFMDENDSGRIPMESGGTYLLFIADISTIDIASCCGNSGLISEKKGILENLEKLQNQSSDPAR